MLRKRVVNVAFSAAFLILGVIDIVSQRGSHLFSESTVYRFKGIPFVNARYTGTAATVEGLIFIGAGVFFLYRALKGRDDNGQGSDAD
ncbi:MAG: hypothetical protein ACJ8M4_01785 [Chthoniobacterales bacterium]